MILATIITAVVIAGIIGTFWQSMVNFLKSAIEKVKNLVSGVVYGCKVFVKKLSEGIKEISRHYSKVEQHWEETIVTRTVSESDVPSDILARAKSYEEVDITADVELKMENAY